MTRLVVVLTRIGRGPTQGRLCTPDILGVSRSVRATISQGRADNSCSAGGRIALGSDFPVESIDPLKGFYAAVTRLAEDGTSPHGAQGWYPHMKLTREEALRGMTVDGALLLLYDPGVRTDYDSRLRCVLQQHWLADSWHALRRCRLGR